MGTILPTKRLLPTFKHLIIMRALTSAIFLNTAIAQAAECSKHPDMNQWVSNAECNNCAIYPGWPCWNRKTGEALLSGDGIPFCTAACTEGITMPEGQDYRGSDVYLGTRPGGSSPDNKP